MCRNEVPSFLFGTPGAKLIVCVPSLGQRDAKRISPGIFRPRLDLFCQIPVSS